MKKIFLIPLLVCAAGLKVEAQEEVSVDSGYHYYELGNYKEAIVHFNKVIEEQPRNAEAFYLRGVCKSQLGSNKEAIMDYDSALKLQPEYPEVFFEKGYAYFHLNEFQKAIASFDKALDQNPGYTEALVNRGSVKCIIGKKEEAENDWARAKELGAELPDFKCD